jgi:N-acyl-D-amino-acid deacylase
MSIRVRESFDVLITAGRIIDGTGNPWFRGDIGVRRDRIAAIGKLSGASARVVIDAKDRIVCPGLVDAHVHGDLALFMDPLHEPAIRQGVTTYIIGQDGVAMAPASPAVLDYMCRYTAGFSGGAEWLRRPEGDRLHWSSMDEYLSCFDGRCALNVACLVPNGNVRMEVMGLATRAPTTDELADMQRRIREAMEQGAVGLSSGLDYIPSLYAQEAELAELCKAIEPYGGVYVTHMRRYDPAGVAGSLGEVFRIGESAGVGVHVSHFNSQAGLVLPLLDDASRRSIDVTFDLYCYLAGSSILAMNVLPAWVQEGGIDATLKRLRDPATWPRLREWFAAPRVPLESVRLSYVASPQWRRFEGMTLREAVAAGADGQADPEQVGRFILDILTASDMAVGCVVPHRFRGEEDIRGLMRHPAMMGGSDAIFTGSRPHPRGCGCCARYLGHYVREGVWSLETAVMRLAAHPARRFGLRDRGLLAPGMAADIVVFDPAAITDRATFDDGRTLGTGVEHVLVNGELVLRAGQRTAALPGRGLRRG